MRSETQAIPDLLGDLPPEAVQLACCVASASQRLPALVVGLVFGQAAHRIRLQPPSRLDELACALVAVRGMVNTTADDLRTQIIAEAQFMGAAYADRLRLVLSWLDSVEAAHGVALH
jgi:hypothetical protein